MNKRIGVIGIPGKWSSEVLADTLEKKTGFRLLISMDDVSVNLEKRQVWFRDHNLATLDAVLVKKLASDYEPEMMNRLEILRFLEAQGVAVFSRPASIAGLLNRLNCTTTLCLGDIPIPPTVVTENVSEAHRAMKIFGTAVFKPLFTSKARGMQVIADSRSALDEIRAYQNNGNRTMYIQKFFPLPGKDLGLVFLGGKYLATYARVRQNSSWNTTTLSGGKYEPFEPDEKLIELGRRSQALFNLDFTCVDLAETETGPVVFEVSAFGGFRGLEVAHHMNAADLLVDHILAKMA
ncbi:MAG: GAK system ATP-grasp enzyme [bacterium]|nr:GAK system ATP-grasp enzyme [bacterium]